MGDIYVATTGDDDTGDGSVGNPYATPGKAADVAGSGDDIWVKSGTYTITTSTPGASGPVVLPSASLIRMEGYASTIGDLGAKPVISAGAVDTISIVKLQGNYQTKRHLVRNIKVDGNSQTDVIGFEGGGSYNQDRVYQCEAIDCTSHGFEGTSMVCDQSKADGCGVGFETHANYRCVANDCTSHGFESGSTSGSHHSFCIASNNGGRGFYADSSGYKTEWNLCIAYNNTGDGFQSASYGMNHCFYCISVSNGGYGFNWPNADGILQTCSSYDNTSGRETGVGEDLDGINLSADPFVDAGNDDFNLNDVAGAGTALRAIILTL